MDQKLDLSLPAVPPAPAGERVEPHARGLAGLIAGLESAVVYHRSDRLTAMVIVLNGRVVDAVAQTRTEVLKGVDVLDEVSDLPIAELEVIEVPPRLARALPVYWRAQGATKEMVGSLIRPGRRGAVLASSPTHGLGLIVFDERGIVASFADGRMSDDAVDAILDDPETIIAPRAEPLAGRRAPDLRPSAGEEELSPPAQEPEPAPAPQPELADSALPAANAAPVPADPQGQPASGAPAPGPQEPAPAPSPFAVPGFGHPDEQPQQPFGVVGPFAQPPAGDFPQAPDPNTAPPFGGPSPQSGFNGWAPSQNQPAVGSPYGSTPAADGDLEPRRQAILDLLQRELGRHAESVGAPFRTAPTLEALQGAAQALAEEQVRLVTPTRMRNLSQQASAIARGEQPPA